MQLNQGKILNRNRFNGSESFEEISAKAGFSRVSVEPMARASDGAVSDHYGIYREGQATPYGVVKGQYNVVQDERFLEAAMKVCKNSPYKILSADLVCNGEKGIISLKHGEQDCGGNPVENVRNIVWGHNGKSGIKIFPTSFVLACFNRVPFGIRLAKKNGSLISFTHKGDVHVNLQAWSAEYSRDSDLFSKQAEVFERMKERQTTPKEVAELAERIAGIKAEDLKKEGRGLTIKRNAIDELFSRSVNSEYIGSRSEYKGSLWEPYMVATEILDHGSPNAKTVGMERQFTTTYQSKSAKVTELFEELLNRPVGENSSYEFQHLVEFGTGSASVSFMDLPIVKS